ncbi:MAG: vitamin K epoxide reductase family protein [Gemmatimonadetes bacterium]|nr:vitamin K epoxide reductase family protein [Gemmatimonadota bacterium]
MRSTRLGRARVALTAVGLAIAVYLTLLHYVTGVPLVCGRGALVDCETVLQSPSAVVLGLPVALWGLLWFAVALVLALLSARGGGDPEPPRLWGIGFTWTLIGTVAVLRLVYQEIGVIGKICAWCTAVHVLVLALLVVQVQAHRPRGAASSS